MEKILLIGIWGVYNYGCEAIVRGTVNILRDYNPNIKITYLSFNYHDDCKRLSGCDIDIIEGKRPKKWSIRNVLRKLLSYVGIRIEMPYERMSVAKGHDAVFSIGGDIYTINEKGMYFPALPKFLEKCQKIGIKYVLWGASVGPFEANSNALTFYKRHLGKIDKIFVRELNTYEYLNNLGLNDNLVLAPDPAFFIQGTKDICYSGKGSPMTVGVNLSPMSAAYAYESLDVAVIKQSKSIEDLIRKLSCEVVLIPHVLSEENFDDDLGYLNRIRAAMPLDVAGNVRIIDNDPGFVGLKKELRQCDFVIAARMHCAVNAICENVPTLFLSYSEKAKGMARFVYGDDSAVMPIKDFENVDFVLTKIYNVKQLKTNISQIRNFDFTPHLKNI